LILGAEQSADYASAPWFFYAGFLAFVIAMLLVDLKFFHTEEHEPTIRESATWVGIWVSLAVVFGVLVFITKGVESGAEYTAGYLIEYSLSVDNMFVFAVIFGYFRVPFAYQHQVLFYGILGAIIFRGLFIWAGVQLISRFDWVIYIFGAFLIFTAIRIIRGTEEIHPEENPILKFIVKRFRATHSYAGQRLFTIENGKRIATPLFVTLLFVEFTDIVFAVDSIPAIFGITEDPFIILTSNVFAILGLRALYFLLAGAMDRFHLLNYGLGIVLAFIGVKMLLTAVSCTGDSFFCHEGQIEIPIWLSLAFIVLVLGATVWLSLKIPPRKEDHEIPHPLHEEKEPVNPDGESSEKSPEREDERRSGRC